MQPKEESCRRSPRSRLAAEPAGPELPRHGRPRSGQSSVVVMSPTSPECSAHVALGTGAVVPGGEGLFRTSCAESGVLSSRPRGSRSRCSTACSRARAEPWRNSVVSCKPWRPGSRIGAAMRASNAGTAARSISSATRSFCAVVFPRSAQRSSVNCAVGRCRFSGATTFLT